MRVKLFAINGDTPSQQVISLLEQADMDYELIDPNDSLMGYQVMFSVTGSRKVPVLCVNGKAYRGVESAQQFFATR